MQSYLEDGWEPSKLRRGRRGSVAPQGTFDHFDEIQFQSFNQFTSQSDEAHSFTFDYLDEI